MKILIPVLGFGRAGGYRVLSKLADELIKLRHSVKFICPDGSEDPYFPTLAKILWIDSKGLLSPDKKKSPKKENVFSIQQKLTQALRKIPQSSYDVIIANHSLTTLPIRRAGLVHKTLYYVQAYEPEFYGSSGIKNRILAYLSNRSYKMNLFTVVNGQTYLNYKELKSSRVLYPGIDFDLFYPNAKKLLEEKERPIIIGTIGRKERNKGTRYIVEAFQKIKKNFPNVELHIAFGEPLEFTDQKDIHCFQPHGDQALGNFYRSLDYYICAAYVQIGAFHYPVVEAMSCGASVITTQYYPSNEANAWIIKKLQDADDIVSTFEKAYTSPLLKQQKLKQSLIDVRQFEWSAVGKKLNGYIHELVNSSQETI